MITSLLYQGKVRHRRYTQCAHHFNYNIFMFCFDIAAIPESFSILKKVSVEKFNWFSFRRKNYLDNSTIDLDQAARDLVQRNLGFYPKGKIYLLTHLSCLGYCFNPISLYFVYDENHDVIVALIIEVTNTPWGKKHLYVQKVQAERPNIYTCLFKKELHVSPFLTMNYTYQFNLKVDTNRILVHMQSLQNHERHFDATLMLQAIPPEVRSMNDVLRTHPFMTYKVSAAIYWQAFKLWLKGAKFYSYPMKKKD